MVKSHYFLAPTTILPNKTRRQSTGAAPFFHVITPGGFSQAMIVRPSKKSMGFGSRDVGLKKVSASGRRGVISRRMLGVFGVLVMQGVLLLGLGGWVARRGGMGEAMLVLAGAGTAHAGGVSVWVSDGGLLRNPRGIVFDSVGNAFVAVQGTDSVTKVTAAGVVSEFATGLQNPWGVALDGAGNLYVTLVNKKELWKISPDGSRTLVASGLKNMHHLVFNPSDGLLYVTREDGVSTVNPNTGVVNALWQTPYPNGTDNCWGITLDGAGGFFVAMKLSRNEWLFHVTPDGQGGLSTATVETDGNKIPRSLAMDALGNL